MESEATNTELNDLITRSAEPLNLEMPFSTLSDFLTPNERFYVRCHFPIPRMSAESWRLEIEGEVEKPFALTYEELRALPRHAITATMECAGNGRSHLEPKVKGVAWDIGAVGNAEWSGVLLRHVLERAGVRPDATTVILQGGDRGAIKEPPRPPGEINYARSIPIAKATSDALLALEMNGEPLTPEHGYPLRAVVPGWFGMASVKWLERVIVTAVPFTGYYESIDYTYWDRHADSPELKPLREMQVKAQIARPAIREVVPAGEPYAVRGAAWGAEDEVTTVELSVDGGRRWAAADLLGEATKYAWRFWRFNWQTPTEAGNYTLIARATDSAGRTQPRERVAEYGSYMVNHWLPITVEVR